MSARLVLLVATALASWLAVGPAPAPAPPTADPADVASLDALVAALYDVISGDAGEPRDWERFESLFDPSARLVPIGRRAADAPVDAFPMTPREYRERNAPAFETTAFHETELARRTERFGHVAHVFSTYAARCCPDDAEPFMRGINSIQALWNGERWSVLSIVWDPERPDQPLPPEYLSADADGG